jgi:ubiquinone/menaquinone biosynthesis C-methylase UbiE
MRPTVHSESPLEYFAVKLNLAPVPVGEMMYGMPMARSLVAGARLGVFERLANGAASADELARELKLAPAGTRLLLDALAVTGHLTRDGDRYAMSDRARRWLDPASDTYVGTFIAHGFEFWRWWGDLEDVVRTGKSFEIHEQGLDEPHWRLYIRGQFELARLSATEVAKALRLPREPRALLDVAGGHGWFSAALCRRHPSLKATVLDLPASAAVGREIIAEAGMSDRVHHVEGDLATSELGGPYDGALCFNIVHHLTPEQNVALLKRIHAALAPGGTVAVLDLFAEPAKRKPDTAAYLGLFFYLTSAAATYRSDELAQWLAEAGFEPPRKITIRRIPGQLVFEAKKPS